MHLKISALKNGFTSITCPIPHVDTLSLGVWIKAGARDETLHEHGIAHLLEHMAFKGTQKRSALQIATEIESVGGEINAATSIETTSYFTRTLGENLPLGMDILADILQNSSLSEEELEKEKQVILQEISAAFDAPDDIIFDYFTKTAFQNQAIGRPILGTKESVLSFSRDDIKNFMDKNYKASQIVVIGTGKVEHDTFEALIEENFSQYLQEPTDHVTKSLPKVKYTGGDYREERDLMDTHIVMGFEGRPQNAEDFYSCQILSIILGGGMSSRLFQEVREKRGLCYSIYAFHWGFSDCGLFGIHAASNKESIKDLMDVIVEQLHAIIENIDQAEVDRACAQYRAGLIMSKETPSGMMHYIARQYFFHNKILKIDLN